MPIGIVAHAFTLLWDNLCRDSCIMLSSMQTLTQGSSRKGTRVARCRVQLHDGPKCQALVIRKVDNTIQRIVRFVSSTLSHWIAIYPVDQALSNLQTTRARFISLSNFERVCGAHCNRNKPFTKTSLESYRLV